MNRKLKTVTRELFNYCLSNNWAGYDPYDALNSELFKKLPFLDWRLTRLAMTQILKRSPINFRPLLMIPKTQNPKALALFLMALLKLENSGMLNDTSLIPSMVQNIIALRSDNNLLTENRKPSTCNHRYQSTDNCEPVTVNRLSNRQLETVNCEPVTVNRYYCWGYSFPWQGRSVLASRGEANLVCTVFVANAFLDLYEAQLCQLEKVNRKLETGYCQLSADNLLNIASSSADYLMNELFWTDGDEAGFSYPVPSIKTKVHNANFLGAALLCRIYRHTDNKKYLEPALKAARYSARMQQHDGSWNYGELPTQRWIDNFHTGYNLVALQTISKYLNTDEFLLNIKRGLQFYTNHFFRQNGAPKYFHNKAYPFDIHSVAQSIITLLEMKDLDHNNIELACRIFDWTVANMWDKRGYFHYQITPYYKNRISYMRWSQAWMLLALTTLLETVNCKPSLSVNCLYNWKL
ncbi:MAG: hypothetical protein WAP08_04785 [Smithellaceae bacterium]|jgi:hypothetical protein|nr:hypothetical protein [Syntrophaceae bacterium]